MNRWAFRGLAAVLTLAAAMVQFHGSRPPDSSLLLSPLSQALHAAGYTTDVRDRTFLGGAVVNGAVMTARHAQCALPIRITVQPVVDRTANRDAEGATPLYVFGDLAGVQPRRWRLMVEAAKVQMLYLLRMGRRGNPYLTMAIVSDPSACLVLSQPDWARIWYG